MGIKGAPSLPRVSVIIPYYASAWSVDRTLRSVMAQTYQDFEVILIDDGSPDDVAPLVASYGDRVRLVRQENLGLGAARNRGMRESSGEFVAPIDADDLWHPEYLAEMVEALDESHAAPFAYSASYRVDEDDMLLATLVLPKPPRHDFSGLISLNSVGCGSAAVFRKAAMVSVDGYDETLKARAAQGAEDWKLIVQLAERATPVFINRYLVAYRLTRAGMSQAHPDRQLAAIEAVIEDLRAAYPACDAQIFRDARTMMIAWLLPAFLRRRMWRNALQLAMTAYLLNPLWWLNGNVRLIHMARVRMAFGGLFRQPPSLQRLADLEERGHRPFAFLDV